jgi:dTDP-glucose 4,6-dehydratase
MRILVTGGCGFIGSNFIEFLLKESDADFDKILNIDKMTYAGKGRNLEHMALDSNRKYSFFKGDISEKSFVSKAFGIFKPNIIFNFAAESHVDRSITDSSNFAMTNVVGTVNLLDASLRKGIEKFIQISTDEVYGSIDKGSFNEEDILNPSSPYSASKASSDHFARSYYITHQLPTVITRSANNYGPYQFPEKLLPLFITNLIDNKKVPLMWSEENPGLNFRDWINVKDNCRAIWFISSNGKNGEIYNIPGNNKKTNLEITRKLLENFDYGIDMIEKIPHRKGHDFGYSISGDKLKNLGFNYLCTDFDLELKNLCNWYKNNQTWWRAIKK